MGSDILSPFTGKEEVVDVSVGKDLGARMLVWGKQRRLYADVLDLEGLTGFSTQTL